MIELLIYDIYLFDGVPMVIQNPISLVYNQLNFKIYILTSIWWYFSSDMSRKSSLFAVQKRLSIFWDYLLTSCFYVLKFTEVKKIYGKMPLELLFDITVEWNKILKF